MHGKNHQNEKGKPAYVFLFQLNRKFEKVACGKTDDQLVMTEMARKFVSVLKPRSLKL